MKRIVMQALFLTFYKFKTFSITPLYYWCVFFGFEMDKISVKFSHDYWLLLQIYLWMKMTVFIVKFDRLIWHLFIIGGLLA